MDDFKEGGSFVRRQWDLVYLLSVLWAVTNGNRNTYDLAVLPGDLCGFDDDHIHSCNFHESAGFALELIASVKSELR